MYLAGKDIRSKAAAEFEQNSLSFCVLISNSDRSLVFKFMFVSRRRIIAVWTTLILILLFVSLTYR